MPNKINRFVYWAPRIIIILFALFLAVFSFDVFDPASSPLQIVIGLLIHNIPSFVLVALLIISWNHDKRGGIIFTSLGIACAIWAIIALSMHSEKSIPVSIMGSIIFLAIGALFLAEQKLTHKAS